MNDVIAVTVGFGFIGLAALLAIVLALNPEWLEDKPHPDEPAYRKHQSCRVVRAAPGEEVKA